MLLRERHLVVPTKHYFFAGGKHTLDWPWLGTDGLSISEIKRPLVRRGVGEGGRPIGQRGGRLSSPPRSTAARQNVEDTLDRIPSLW